MYALVDPKSFCWPQVPAISTLPANQVYMAPVPVTPTYLIGGPAAPPQVYPMVAPAAAGNQTPSTASTSPVTPALYYSLHPNYGFNNQPSAPPAITSSTRQRTSSDDVFIVDNSATTNFNTNNTNAVRIAALPPTKSVNVNIRPRRRQRMAGAADEDDVMSLGSISPYKDSKKCRGQRSRQRSTSDTASSDFSGSECSPQRSLDSGRSSGASSLRSSISPQNAKTKFNGNNHVSMEHSSSKESTSIDVNDISLFNIFSASLYSALNRDPPEPAVKSDSDSDLVFPLKTSSPLPDEKYGWDLVQKAPQSDKTTEKQNNAQKSNGRKQDPFDNESLQDGQNGNRRQKFLRALEEERERQRCLVLPKHAPKMTCKFCKNNGESIEIYSKHRLHFNEKTVCPLLRMYVCRLCNSTGDFAHTIRHCPFNSRFDKVAWKATFL